ncbi:hypothetical protein GCM10027614_74190 [Micromonospora vulcania]
MPGTVANSLVPVPQCPPPGDHRVQSAELGPAESGQQRAEPVVVADVPVLVVRHRLAGLGGQVAGSGDQGGVVGDQHPPAEVVITLLWLNE